MKPSEQLGENSGVDLSKSELEQIENNLSTPHFDLVSPQLDLINSSPKQNLQDASNVKTLSLTTPHSSTHAQPCFDYGTFHPTSRSYEPAENFKEPAAWNKQINFFTPSQPLYHQQLPTYFTSQPSYYPSLSYTSSQYPLQYNQQNYYAENLPLDNSYLLHRPSKLYSSNSFYYPLSNTTPNLTYGYPYNTPNSSAYHYSIPTDPFPTTSDIPHKNFGNFKEDLAFSNNSFHDSQYISQYPSSIMTLPSQSASYTPTINANNGFQSQEVYNYEPAPNTTGFYLPHQSAYQFPAPTYYNPHIYTPNYSPSHNPWLSSIPNLSYNPYNISPHTPGHQYPIYSPNPMIKPHYVQYTHLPPTLNSIPPQSYISPRTSQPYFLDTNKANLKEGNEVDNVNYYPVFDSRIKEQIPPLLDAYNLINQNNQSPGKDNFNRIEASTISRPSPLQLPPRNMLEEFPQVSIDKSTSHKPSNYDNNIKPLFIQHPSTLETPNSPTHPSNNEKLEENQEKVLLNTSTNNSLISEHFFHSEHDNHNKYHHNADSSSISASSRLSTMPNLEANSHISVSTSLDIDQISSDKIDSKDHSISHTEIETPVNVKYTSNYSKTLSDNTNTPNTIIIKNKQDESLTKNEHSDTIIQSPSQPVDNTYTRKTHPRHKNSRSRGFSNNLSSSTHTSVTHTNEVLKNTPFSANDNEINNFDTSKSLSKAANLSNIIRKPFKHNNNLLDLNKTMSQQPNNDTDSSQPLIITEHLERFQGHYPLHNNRHKPTQQQRQQPHTNNFCNGEQRNYLNAYRQHKNRDELIKDNNNKGHVNSKKDSYQKNQHTRTRHSQTDIP